MAKTEATIADLYAVGEDDRVELVDGELIPMAPVSWEHADIGSEILFALKLYQRQQGWGYAMGDGLGYIINAPRQRSFSPDVSYALAPPRDRARFAEGAPLFAVEIRSPSDYRVQAHRAYEAKRADYFSAGTQVVWDVDPEGHTILSYYRDRPNAPTIFHLGETADAEPALPGWRIAVDDLFPPVP